MEDPQHLSNEYIKQLNTQEKIALDIAKKLLKSSFDIEKTIGFIDWKKKLASSCKSSN